MSNIVEHRTRQRLYDLLAQEFVNDLNKVLARKERAGIALSGGSTPQPIYERMSAAPQIAWERVDVTLADERLTDPNDEGSNEHLIRNTLLKGEAGKATFFPLREEGTLPCPVDTILLGMGGDGHFASLFPTAKELEKGLSPDAPDVLRVTPDPLPAEAPWPRMSMSLRAILAVPVIRLAITGEQKRDVYERAYHAKDGNLPIRALLAADHPYLTVHWAP